MPKNDRTSNERAGARQFATSRPLSRSSARLESAAVDAAPRVLVVDDDDDARAMYADYLAWRGYRVQRANDGAAAIACAVSAPPDAILIDLSMANMDGLSAVRWLKSNERTSATPIIMLTSAGPDAYGDAKAAGCDVFVCKPCTPDALEQVLHSVLKTRRA